MIISWYFHEFFVLFWFLKVSFQFVLLFRSLSTTNEWDVHCNAHYRCIIVRFSVVDEPFWDIQKRKNVK